MSNRAAYRLLGALCIFAIAYELVLTRGPAVGKPFEGLWQVWHPYYLPLLGLATLPFMVGYALPLARRLGGRATVWGRTIWFLAAGVLAYTVLGTSVTFYEITCAQWGPLSCDRQLGFLPHPNWGDVGFLLVYPLVAIGLASLLRALGTSWTAELRRRWWVPTLILVCLGALAAPFALDVVIADEQSLGGTIVDLSMLAGLLVILSLAIFAAYNTRELAGGRFRTPVLIQLAGLASIGFGTLLNVHTNATGRMFSANDPSTVPHTIGFVLWIISFLMVGAALERMLGSAAPTTRQVSAAA